VRVQRILIESIKYSLIPYVSKLETAKAIYDKLEELFFVSTAREVISLRKELYKLNISKEDGITSYFMRISEIQDQLQKQGEVMSDREMTTVVLNALLKEWGTSLQVYMGRKRLLHLKIYGHFVRSKKPD